MFFSAPEAPLPILDLHYRLARPNLSLLLHFLTFSSCSSFPASSVPLASYCSNQLAQGSTRAFQDKTLQPRLERPQKNRIHVDHGKIQFTGVLDSFVADAGFQPLCLQQARPVMELLAQGRQWLKVDGGLVKRS